MWICLAHTVGELDKEFLYDMVVGGMFGEHFPLVEREHSLYCRNFFKFHIVENRLVGKQHHTFGVIDDVHGILYVEVVQHRHDDCSIGDGGHVCLDP